MVVGIYKITNKINGKIYIGQSNNIVKRWDNHKRTSFNVKSKNYNYPLYQAMRKYGLENFKFEVIEECSIEQLDEKEIYWINFYQTFPPDLGKGYNLTPGGNRNIGKSKILYQLEELKNLLQYSDLSQSEIAKRYGVSLGTVRGINNGITWHDRNIDYPIRKSKVSYIKVEHIILKLRKISIPSYEELFKSFYELRNKELVAKKYNVSTMTVKKWCKHYGINAQRKKEFIEKYEIEFLGKEPKKKRPILKIAQIDPKNNGIIRVFNSKKEVRCYLGLNPGCDKALIKAMKSGDIYKNYKWEKLN